MPFITYIVPVRNESFILRDNHVIINQKHENMLFEIIVVDGMSIDGTRGKIEGPKKV